MQTDSRDIDYKNIPVQADVISGILRLDPDDLDAFAVLDRYLQSDQGVAALVLRVVNSPIYSRGRQIATLPAAITVLGFNVVRSLAMLAFSRYMFSGTRDPAFRKHLWQHSLLTAIAARNLSRILEHSAEQEEAFVAGLMHDMGKVLMFIHRPADYARVLDGVLQHGLGFVAAEREVFGYDHCDVGREAVRQWSLPERFSDYMGTDLADSGAISQDAPVSWSVALSNRFVEDMGVGGVLKEDVDARRAGLMSFGLDQDMCERVLGDEMAKELAEDDVFVLCAGM